MTDLISRQAAIDALRYAQHRFIVADEADGLGHVRWSEDVIFFDKAEEILAGLPSAQQWIPCSEKLPEVDVKVLTYAKHSGGAWMIDISSFSGVVNHGKPNFWGYGDKMEVLAWMPLPEPYKESNV